MLKRPFAYLFIFMTHYVNYQKYLDIHSCNQLQKGGKIGYLNLYLASKQAVAVGRVQRLPSGICPTTQSPYAQTSFGLLNPPGYLMQDSRISHADSRIYHAEL